MKRYTSCLVFAAWLCASAKADDDSGYTPPQPLREAVTARSAATDINDTSLTGAPEKSPVEVADSLRQGATAPQKNTDDATLSRALADASGAQPTDEAKMSEITGSSAPAGSSMNEAGSNSAPAVVPQIDELAAKPMAPAMVQTKRLFSDPITEMMGGEFNTEDNQRMAESFLSVRPRILHMKSNRDF